MFFAPRPQDGTLTRFAWRGVRIFIVGGILSVTGALLFAKNFGAAMAYSLSITMMCWFFIDGGINAVASLIYRHDPECRAGATKWPAWPWTVAVILGGTIVGHSLGVALGNLVTGYDMPGLLNSDYRRALGLLAVALLPGIATTYFFYSRHRLASSEAVAQTAQRQAAENQLRLLESQLEPHMLFNTLANLRVLIGIDPPRAQLMLDRLIAFLRATLVASRETRHPLSSEFARIADYLALMKIRMGDRLQTQLQLPPELADWPVPPLLLQPLVENAIKHGLEPHVDGGRLHVSAERRGAHLVLQVRDTGAGLSAGAASPRGTRFGLQQVRERLHTLHGAAATLDLEPATDAEGGTLATIRIPLTPP